MTSSMRQPQRCAMSFKFNTKCLALFCTVLIAEGVQAENCRLSVSQPRIDYGVIRNEARAESPLLALVSAGCSSMCCVWSPRLSA